MVLFIAVNSYSQDGIPLIGTEAPSFRAESTRGKINFPKDYGNSWKVLFSHPQDFTPVCSSELLELAGMEKDFDKLNTKIAVVSTDNLEQHNLWVKYLEGIDYRNRGPQKIYFPIIDDSDANVARMYGMIHNKASSNRDVRGVFIIDPDNVIRSVNFYPMEVGRNMQEIERTLEALQKTDKEHVLTPANWKEGEDVLVPYFPYTKKQLEENPSLADNYYNMGNRVWFKKVNGKQAEK